MRDAFGLLLLVSAVGIGMMPAQSPNHGTEPGSFAEVNGSRLYYEECGTGPKAVVLLHDGVVNSAVWDDVWPAFCKHFHTIRYDLRGYGRSPETKKPYYEADDVAALLRDRKIGQAALVASSHGGNIALSFALRYPHRLVIWCLWAPPQRVFLPLRTS
jgi:3-oxoadipate enol-lactonase